MKYTEWKLGENSVAGMMTMPDMVPAEVPAPGSCTSGPRTTPQSPRRASSGPPSWSPRRTFLPVVSPCLSTQTALPFAVIKMAPMPS